MEALKFLLQCGCDYRRPTTDGRTMRQELMHRIRNDDPTESDSVKDRNRRNVHYYRQCLAVLDEHFRTFTLAPQIEQHLFRRVLEEHLPEEEARCLSTDTIAPRKDCPQLHDFLSSLSRERHSVERSEDSMIPPPDRQHEHGASLLRASEDDCQHQ